MNQEDYKRLLAIEEVNTFFTKIYVCWEELENKNEANKESAIKNKSKYNKGIMKTLRDEVGLRGFTYYDWNVDSNDAGTCAKKSTTDKKTCVYSNVVNNLSKSRPNMVLMHDISLTSYIKIT